MRACILRLDVGFKIKYCAKFFIVIRVVLYPCYQVGFGSGLLADVMNFRKADAK